MEASESAREARSGEVSAFNTQQQDVDSMRGFGLKRSKGLAKENQSEYFYKDLIVEPRKNPVFKQWSEPFSLETMRKCDYNELP